MPTVINTNLASLFAQNSLTNAQNNLAQSVQRLSSGLRINSAKDDGAGLAIAQLMQSNINGVNQSIRNMSDATNLLQTADTGLATVQDMLLRMKQLSVQGYDGSLSAAQKVNIVTELVDLNAEINATAGRTTFNNINLLGSAQGVDSATGDIYAGAMLTKTQVIDGLETGKEYINTDTVTYLGPAETGYVTFAALADTETVTMAGLTFTSAGGTTAAELAAAFANIKDGMTAAEANTANTLTVGNFGTFTAGAASGWTSGSVVDSNHVLFTSTSNGNVTNLSNTGDITLGIINVNGTDTGTTATYEIIADPNSDAYRMLPGTYTFNSNGNQLTLSTTINGRYMTETVTVGNAVADVSQDIETNQELVFNSLGIKLNVSTTVNAGDQTQEGADIAALFDTRQIVIQGASAKITDINVSNARSGTYTLTDNDTGRVTATFTDLEGNVSTEAVTLASFIPGSGTSFLAGNTYKVKFDAMGISMDIHAYQDMTTTEIANELTELNNFNLGGATGQLYVTQGSADALKFQSGPNSDSFIQINTLNIRTDSNSSNIAMRDVGSVVQRLAGLGVSNTTDDWQDAFMDLDTAVENAQVYISQERAVFGSQMNRVSYLSTNLTSQSTNLQNSRSSIIDTDFASETAKLTRGQIMQQAATAMLAQANQMPNVVLSLLK
jgi:flagellin